MNQKSAGFMYLKNKFLRIRDAKQRRVFIGPQIRELIQDTKFEDQLSEVEKAAWFINLNTNIYGKFIRHNSIVKRWLPVTRRETGLASPWNQQQ
jgi:hypothetical protein